MAYTDFKSLKQVAEEFNIEVYETNFIKEKEFVVNDYYLNELLLNFKDRNSTANEMAICENLISPIIRVCARENNLNAFSHIYFEYKKNKKLQGIPDYMVGIKSKFDPSYVELPVLCLVEAKKDNFIKGWGQVVAEIYAAQQVNKEQDKQIPVYGMVSNGVSWEFGVLKNNILQIHTNSYSAPLQIQELFNTLNWVFCECRKNLDEVLEN